MPSRGAVAVLALCCLGVLGACGGPGPHSMGRSSTTRPLASVSTTESPTSASTTESPTSASTTESSAPVPTLGQLAGSFSGGKGFGQVEPTTVFNGGDPTGLVRDVVWKSWGGATAVAGGVSDYVGPGQTVAAGAEEPATVVAFDLGTCQGRLMYQAVEWYFPQHGQTFDAQQYEDICTGTYVPSP